MRVERIISRGFWLLPIAALFVVSADVDKSGDSIPLEPVAGYWTRPIPAQGSPPASFSPVEASLKPADCGSCHAHQFADWKTALHAAAMSPGVAGQLEDMWQNDPASAASCLSCHAPLTEQAPVLASTDAAGKSSTTKNPAFQPDLSAQGIVCAACHVRQYQHFGPPPVVPAAPPPAGPLPHGGFTPSDFFLSPDFCAPCHQHPMDTAVNGKPIENTLTEWQRSPYPRAGQTCQTCHMPDRRHLWRGIHDPDMVKQAITVGFNASAGGASKRRIVGSLKITNTGAGHDFPTYVTPAVFVRIYQVDAAGNPILGTLKLGTIQRQVVLTATETREISDTRVPPGKSFTLAYSKSVAKGAVAVVGEIEVSPDHYYIDLYESLLSDPGTSPKARQQIEQAHDRAVNSPFIAFRQSLPLR